MLLAVAPLAALTATTCKPSADQGTITILTVDDPFTGPPAATEILVQGVAYDDGGADGAITTLARGSASEGTLDLGSYDETTIESVVVTATDGAGTAVARGETLPVELGALAGATLGVFVQRTGMLSRLPDPLYDSRPSPLLSVVGGRYILVAGGTDSALAEQTGIYDLIAWSPLGSPPVFPVAPASLAVAQLSALAITPQGGVWFDLTESDTSDAGTPSGTPEQWADVAGGATVVASDQSVSYVVGGTRTTGGATNAVLVVAASGALSWATLSTPRLGATAAWVDGLGLVVEGGNVEDGTDASAPAGAEYLPINGTSPVAFDYPADPSSGAGMVALGPPGALPSNVLVVGGMTEKSGTTEMSGGTAARVFTIPCGKPTPCATTTWDATIPTPLAFTQVFAIDAASAFVVGEDVGGAMHAYRLSRTSVAEVPFRVKRSHARAIQLPVGAGKAAGTGAIAVVGGDSTIESFIP